MIKVSRAEWGARKPKAVPLGINTRSATGHWEGTSMGSFVHASCATKVRVIQNYHMDTQGWNDIAYNFLVCPHGYVFIGRNHGVRSSANGTNTGNAESEAVCFMGGIGDQFTPEAQNSMAEIMHEISSTHYCHNHWFNTMCPGPEICNWIKAGMPTEIPVPKPPYNPEDEIEMPPSPTVVHIPEGDFAFVRGSDPSHALWGLKIGEQNSEGQPNWIGLGGNLSSGPDATAREDGSILVVARGQDEATWARERKADGAWGDWFSCGGKS